MRIRILWGFGAVTAFLHDTPTARKIMESLPIETTANRWGDEVYFKVPIKAGLEENAQQVVDPGTICFWVEGQSIAIPWGPTPISKENECRLMTKVNILGRLECDPFPLNALRDGTPLKVEAI